MTGPLRVVLMTSVRWYNAAAAYAVELADALRGRGHVVSLVVKPESPVHREVERRGLDVLETFDLTETAPGRVFANARRLGAALHRFRPDVVNAHRSEDHLLAAFALRGTGIPLVRTRGDVRPPKTGPANRLLYRRATRSHVACADFMPDRYYPPLGIPAGEVTVIRPALDVDAFAAAAPDRASARDRLGLDAGAPLVGLVGRYTAAKGHAVLLEAFARLAVPDRPPPRLLCAGVENEVSVDGLRARAAALGVASRVRFEGRGDDVRTLLAALDVLAVPSVASEAISRIAMEGLALGLPVVASRINSLPEIVGDAGRLVPPSDPDALAAALAEALAAGPDAAREAGPARLRRRYDRTTQVDRTEAVFRAALAGGAAP